MWTDREPRDSTIKFAGGHFKVCLIDLKLPISRFKSIEAQRNHTQRIIKVHPLRLGTASYMSLLIIDPCQ
jgi:hypothetical protein